MTPANVVLLFQDSDTGKAYCRTLSQWEVNLVLAQLQALDGDALKAIEIEPVIIRGAGVSEEKAKRILEKKSSLHLAAREGVRGFLEMAKEYQRAHDYVPQQEKKK